MENDTIKNEAVENLYNQLRESNLKRGYFLNHDLSFTESLVESLLINETRYGYQACPCRLASGVRAEDLDIICPCDYRDADVVEFGTCFCGLYVSKKVFDNKEGIKSIPERRPAKEIPPKTPRPPSPAKRSGGDQPLAERIKNMEQQTINNLSNLSYPVWRCSVCGYLCARAEAPDVCPICGASQDRFGRFI